MILYIIMKNYNIYSIRTFTNNKLIFYNYSKQKRINDILSSYKSRFKRYLNQKDNFMTIFYILQQDKCYIKIEEQITTDNEDIVKSKLYEIIANNECINKLDTDQIEKLCNKTEKIDLNLEKIDLKINDPKIDEPNINEPKIDEPKIDEPKIDEPKIDEPIIDEPIIDETNINEPKIDEPKIDEPNINETNINEPIIDEPKIDEPKIDEPNKQDNLNNENTDIADISKNQVELNTDNTAIEPSNNKVIKLNDIYQDTQQQEHYNRKHNKSMRYLVKEVNKFNKTFKINKNSKNGF
jgi:hypothetical protein